MAKPDPETHLLVAALAPLGIEAVVLPWDAPEDWAGYPLVLVRTPWDYFRRLPEFLAWARRVSTLTQLVNPYRDLEWNSHKSYLRQLAKRGIPTVPTLWLERGCRNGRERLQQTGWDEVVVKPAVSIGAIGALRARAADTGCAVHLQALVDAGDVLVQPYVASVAMTGEASLVFFDGRYSHAVRKQPKEGDFRVQDMYGGTVHAYSPGQDQLDIAVAALALTPEPTTYARVDLVQVDGKPAIMELELIEPELFLAASPAAALRLAEALQDRLRLSRSAHTQ
ncbi:hypothetical protein EKL02_13145 [Janthinobacterium sp. 17J80-10]|nr:hypothetical protein EKL02_13145 [Janthinobacterium sp. 17J80-10]